MPNTNHTEFSQPRLDRQLVGVGARAAARVQVAAELGLSTSHRLVVCEARRRARVAAAK